MSATEAVPALEVQETANDRLKRSFSSWFWGSMIAATVFHFALFAFWPELTAADFSFDSEELEAIELPPEIEIPPPPQQIARPATPVMASADIDEDITRWKICHRLPRSRSWTFRQRRRLRLLQWLRTSRTGPKLSGPWNASIRLFLEMLELVARFRCISSLMRKGWCSSSR